jgi:hypothetical protein
MEYKNFLNKLQHQEIPEPTEAHKEKCWSRAQLAYRSTMNKPLEAQVSKGWGVHWQSFALGTAVAGLITVAIILRSKLTQQELVVSGDEVKALQHGRELFEDHFQGVAFREGKGPEFLVSSEKHTISKQAITVEVGAGNENIRYITFSGERIRIPTISGKLVEVEVLIDGDANVFLMGDDFILRANTLNESLGLRFRAKVHKDLQDQSF